MVRVESVQRVIRGSFLGTLKERGRGKKALTNSMIFPSPVTSFQVAESLPLGMLFPGKVGECTHAANTGESIE